MYSYHTESFKDAAVNGMIVAMHYICHKGVLQMKREPVRIHVACLKRNLMYIHTCISTCKYENYMDYKLGYSNECRRAMSTIRQYSLLSPTLSPYRFEIAVIKISSYDNCAE